MAPGVRRPSFQKICPPYATQAATVCRTQKILSTESERVTVSADSTSSRGLERDWSSADDELDETMRTRSTLNPSATSIWMRKNPSVTSLRGISSHIIAMPTRSFRTKLSIMTGHHLPLIKAMASARLARLLRNIPRTALVTVNAPGFLTPRIVMQVCSASTTTMTP